MCTTPQLGGSRPPSATRRGAILGQIVLLSCKFIAACEDFFRLTAQVIHRRPIIDYGNSINFALSNRHSFQFSCLSRVFSGPTDKRFSPQNTPMKRKRRGVKAGVTPKIVSEIWALCGPCPIRAISVIRGQDFRLRLCRAGQEAVLRACVRKSKKFGRIKNDQKFVRGWRPDRIYIPNPRVI